MATLICNATGNLTGAATFAGAETGALALNLVRNTTASLATASSVTSATFTVTNAKVIDAVLLWVQTSGTVGTGTFKVDLQKGGVSQASVTVNKSDLPDSTNSIPVPVLFKLTSNATGDGGANWTIVLTTTSGTGTATITYNINAAGATNLTRALRTTTAATPAAADDLYIVGELTGAATHTSRTVTMDQTAATAYGSGVVNSTSVAGGGIHISNYGTLSYGIVASTNYVLRVNGDVIVYQFGTFNEGSSGSEVPRNGSAIFELQMTSASGDFGLRCLNNSVVTTAGLSRTVSKNIVKCKLNADIATGLFTSQGIGSLMNMGSATGGTNIAASAVDPYLGRNAAIFTENSAAGFHAIPSGGGTGSVTNVTQTLTIWLAQGTGTHNRFVRLQYGNTGVGALTNGFFADIDLQAGTIGTCTAAGNGTATSSSITPLAGGYICTITGKASSGALSPTVGVQACSAAGTASYTGDSTICFNYYNPQVFTAASVASATLSVDTDTGWLSGDIYCVASTSRTAVDCEGGSLSSNATASTLPSNMLGMTPHSGTAPTQGEIGLLTRNVKIRSTSSTLLGYVYAESLASVNFSWTEFYYLGSSITRKYGMAFDFGATATAKTVTFCSIHDSYYGFVANQGTFTSLNLTYTNNVLWNINGTSANANLVSGFTNNDLTYTDNLIMFSVGAGWSSFQGAYTFNNNTFVGCVSWGINLGNTTGDFAAWSTNTIHSCGGGFNAGSSQCNNTAPVTWSNWSVWRNGNVGTNWNCFTLEQITFDGWTMFGNTTANVNFANPGVYMLTIKNSRMSADTSFATTSNFAMVANVYAEYTLDSLDTSVTGIYAAVTNEFKSAFVSLATVTARNCKWGGTNLLDASWRTNSPHNFFIANERYGQTAGDHRYETYFGIVKSDTTIFNTASPSARMTPNSATYKLESASKGRGTLGAVANGGTVSVSVYIRKSVVGDGTAYNGNQPRLIQRANGALGQNNDVVLATYSSSAGAWNQLTATSSTATDDGAWEFIVDCDGTTGWINVDDWTAS